jgi:hypothetical protein
VTFSIFAQNKKDKLFWIFDMAAPQAILVSGGFISKKNFPL